MIVVQAQPQQPQQFRQVQVPVQQQAACSPCCEQGACCAGFCNYCGEWFMSFVPPPVAHFGLLLKFGNTDFKDTLPKAIALLTFVDILQYISFGIYLIFVGVDLPDIADKDGGGGRLAGGVLEDIIGVWLIIVAVVTYFWNYMFFWAATTGNKGPSRFRGTLL